MLIDKYTILTLLIENHAKSGTIILSTTRWIMDKIFYFHNTKKLNYTTLMIK